MWSAETLIGRLPCKTVKIDLGAGFLHHIKQVLRGFLEHLLTSEFHSDPINRLGYRQLERDI